MEELDKEQGANRVLQPKRLRRLGVTFPSVSLRRCDLWRICSLKKRRVAI
jgi:hypothetical protein